MYKKKLTDVVVLFFVCMNSLLIKNGLMPQYDKGYSIQDMVSSHYMYNSGDFKLLHLSKVALSNLTSPYIYLSILYRWSVYIQT